MSGLVPDLSSSNYAGREQKILATLSALSYRTGQLDNYLQEIAHAVSQLLGLDWSVVTLCQGDSERILASSRNIGPAAEKIYSLHGTLSGAVVQRASPLVVEDTSTQNQYGSAPEGYRAYLGVPLRTSTGKILGTICSFQCQPRKFTDEEVRLAELFAERAAIAIDNYQIYQQLLETNTQLQKEIRERQEAEMALRKSEERFRTLVANAADAFFVVDGEGRFIEVNQRACESLGYTRQELLQMCVPQIQKKLPPEKILEVRRQVDLGHPVTVEGEHCRKDGSSFPVEVRASPFDTNGQRLHLALVRDISERKQGLRALERLAEVGELAAMIVHEVRNPLTTVWMALTSLEKLALPERAKLRLSLGLEEAQRLQRLLNEILLYAKPQKLQLEELEINQLCQEVWGNFKTTPIARGRKLQFEYYQEKVIIHGDRDKLKQVLINLVSNACEAVEEGEAITGNLSYDSQLSCIYLQIRNGGTPIPADVLPKLTKPFFTTKSTGNGLGLAIVKRLVEAHGGDLAISSSENFGTQVKVTLPHTKSA